MRPALLLAKLANALRALALLAAPRVFPRAAAKAGPLTLTLELSAVCNLACPECPAGLGKVRRGRPHMPPDVARRILERHGRGAWVAILYFQGEPMLNPLWGDIAAMAKSYGLFTILSTNGHFLDASNCARLLSAGVDRVVVSVDGATQAEYAAYRRGGKLDVVARGVARLAQARGRRRRPRIVAQTLLTRAVEGRQGEIRSLTRSWGADTVVFKTMQLYDLAAENKERWLPRDRRLRRYALGDGEAVRRSDIGAPRRCRRLLTNAVFTADGVLLPCCFDKTALYPFGRLAADSDADPWRGPSRRGFVARLSGGELRPAMCRNCTERRPAG